MIKSKRDNTCNILMRHLFMVTCMKGLFCLDTCRRSGPDFKLRCASVVLFVSHSW